MKGCRISLLVPLFVLFLAGSASSQEPPPGKELLESRCATCHNLERVLVKKKDRKAWEGTVKRMVAKGAVLSAQEQVLVVDYLEQVAAP